MATSLTRSVVVSVLITLFSVTNAQPAPQYNVGDLVPVSINTVGPYRNPNEKYPFLSKVPFCAPHNEAHQGASAAGDTGSVFMGDRATLSDYLLPFQKNMHESSVVCEKTLDQNEIKRYVDIIRENYMFEFFVDHNLLITGFLGKEEEEGEFFLFTHWNFHCEYNSHYVCFIVLRNIATCLWWPAQVISCRITTDLDKQVELVYGEDLSIAFSYSVSWEEVSISVHDRLMYHVRRLVRSQPLEVHWLSTLNSFILVILVTAFVALVFTTILRQDCARYHELVIMTRDDLEHEIGDERGWKQLQRDVFRSPPYILLFCSIIGCGTQLLVLYICLLLLSLIGLFYPGNRGSIISSIIFVYCFTSGIAGHCSATLYREFGGRKWATLATTTACLFTLPFFVIFLCVNGIAWHYKSSAALPFIYIAAIFSLWLVVTAPLTIYAARRVFKTANTNENVAAAKKTISKVPRQIPQLAWYRSPYLQIALSGILPFTAIYIELHFLFMAIFGHQVYTLFGILSLAFIMLLIVTCAVTIGLTYFQLQSEDWRWWWTSLFTAGSTGAYIFAYSIFYYIYRSYMTGVLQAAIFFGYIGIVSYSFLLMLGATGWWATYLFLIKIYGAIKSE
eukprot:269085_1